MARPTITILYFASATPSPTTRSETLPFPDTGTLPLADLPALIAQRHPHISEVLGRSGWSVNEEMVGLDEGVVLKGGEVVAVIPPVSGG